MKNLAELITMAFEDRDNINKDTQLSLIHI